MDVIIERGIEEVDVDAFRSATQPYDGVLMDIGTGSGRFVYEVARRHPGLLCVGIDAVARDLRRYAVRARRRPARGGAPNAMFVRSAVESLPAELAGMATHITVNLPWGSLLWGIVVGDRAVMENLRRMGSPGTTVEILLTYSASYEPRMIEDRGLPDLTAEHLEDHLVPAYAQHGISVVKADFVDNDTIKRLPLDWGRRLAHGRQRQFAHILGVVRGEESERGTEDEAVSSLLLSFAQ